MKKLFYLLFLSLTIISCDSNDPILPGEDAKSIMLKASQQKRVSQDNEFAFDLLKKTIENSGETNVVVSPLSVSIALGMAWNGASGITKSEMETAMKMSGLTTDDINDYYRIMQSTLPKMDPSTKLSIANSLWYRTGFPVKADYLTINKDYFGAYVREIDFSKSWALDSINGWCSVKTNKLIPTIIDEISPDAMMFLINAVYFKGIWRNKFDKKKTVEGNFTNELKQNSVVNMMQQEDTFAYYSDDLAQYVDLPYGNKAFSMTIVLPSENKTTSDVLKSIGSESFTEKLDNMSVRKIKLFLPRFKVENKFELKPVMEMMGMQQAFTDQADFSKISDIQLLISQIIHKTYVAVDEEGTEAAAVTAIGFETTSMPEYPIVMVDKPFIFLIREKSTGVILFIGKMGSVTKY